MNIPEIAKKLRALANELDAARAHEQLKPFTLPTPPPGMKWHREDGWTAEMLPPGTRPLVEGETYQNGDEGICSNHETFAAITVALGYLPTLQARTTRPLTFTHGGHEWTWHRAGDPMPCAVDTKVYVLCKDGVDLPNATTASAYRWSQENTADIFGWRYADASLPIQTLAQEQVKLTSEMQEAVSQVLKEELQQPDPYAELKAAHAEGKVIQCEQHFLGSGYWYAIDNPQWDEEPRRYRIKPDEAPWIKWHGGECPVAAETVVDVQYRDGSELLNVPALRLIAEKSRDASAAFWSHAGMANDIIAYRVLKTEAPAFKPDEAPWIKWHGGKCPLKDEEVEEWQIKWANGDITTNPKASPSDYIWTKLNSPDDIAAYRVTK